MKLALALILGLAVSQSTFAVDAETTPDASPEAQATLTVCEIYHSADTENEEFKPLGQIQDELTMDEDSMILANLMVIEDTGYALYVKMTEAGTVMSIMTLSRLDPNKGYATAASTTVLPGNFLLYSPLETNQAFLTVCSQ